MLRSIFAQLDFFETPAAERADYMKPWESQNVEELIKSNRSFLKALLWGEWKLRDLETDQRKKVPPPPLEKPYPKDATLIDLISPKDFTIGKKPLIDVISSRRSRRDYTDESLSLEELSLLLWATQGVHEVIRGGTATRRTVPSGGARHPFETYLFINRVSGLPQGLYRYLPLEHQLCFIYSEVDLSDQVYIACYQDFVKNGAVVFMWTTIPYRMEWRYSFLSHKVIAQETGHICQNLYLACESIGAGACALGTYNQEEVDAILRINGDDEFAIYVGVVGKVEADS